VIRHKLTLAAGFAAGYVLGAKAGEQRYRQIEAKFRELAGMPAVQDLTNNLADTAGQIGEKAKATVNEKVSAVADKVTGGDDVVDLSTGSKSRTGARTANAPMAGATASATAPDVP
jgi:hypothetical protein